MKLLLKYLRISTNYKGTILALHGWNLPHLDWCTKTSLCEKAKEQGYIVVLPNMGRAHILTVIIQKREKKTGIFSYQKMV